MAMSAAERKRRQRERQKHLNIQPFVMELTAVERAAIDEAATARGFVDRTEYIMSLVFSDRDMSRNENVCKFPACDCPYDIGADGKCIVGKPRAQEVSNGI